MVSDFDDTERQRAFLSTLPAQQAERRLAIAVVLVSLVSFVVAIPLVRVRLPAIPAFIPSYEAALFITDLITAVLLLGQFTRLRSRGMLLLAAGYLFDSLIIIPHALTFPAVFAPTGLLGAGDQSTAWLYVFWHGGFPLFVLGYAVSAGRGADTVRHLGAAVATAVGGVIVLVVALTVLATRGQDLLPIIVQAGDYSLLVTTGASPAVWCLSLAALVALWRRGGPSVLDLWLMVVMCAWLFDVGLSAVFGSTRFDFGWYAGRSYGLLAASFVLAALLLEMNRLYSRFEGAVRTAGSRHAELLRSREALGHAQRLEAVGQLTGGVAHDFNNLLTVVTGNLELILTTPDNAERVERLAKMAMKASVRGARLIEQLLTFARRQVSRPETLNLNRLVSDFDALMRRAAGHGVEIVSLLNVTLDSVRIDRAQCEAAILNLVVNARDAMTGSGRITIETLNVVLDADYAAENPDVAPGCYVLIAIGDTGVGMSPEVTARAFEPFFTTKEVGKGSGLGLSQVYGFAKSSGGHVKIYSEPGVGTTVKLYLPASSERLRTSEAHHPELVPLRVAQGSETILVVEDDEDVLGVAVESLSGLGYTVLTATDAGQALKILRGSQSVDLMFSDVIMPGGMSGAQLANEARRLRPALKVLLTSGYTATALSQEHGLPEDLEILGKPYRRDDLANKLRLVIQA
jgi:signal transduction histidine kinase/CheY-like chemotaxis protein